MGDPRAVIEAFLDRLGSRDLDGVLELYREPVDHAVHGSPLVPWLGQRSSKAQIREFLQLLRASCELERFAVEKILVDGNESVVLGEFAYRVKKTGRRFASAFALRMTVSEDGKIVRHHMHEDSYAIHMAFLPNPG